MLVKYQEAVVMLEQLQREKTYNYNELAKYKREVETLRGVMRGYLRQIDSLNTINSDLQARNVEYQREISTAQLRADVAEEKADELGTKVRIGSVIRASGVRIVALNNNSREVRKIRQASRLRVDLELTANELAEPGEKSIYICITAPDGYVLASEDMIVFNFEGDEMMASAVRKVDYENESVPVSIFYDGSHFEKGTYKVDIYIDGRHSGSQETYFE
jgi:predicted RNase H-like nuclease (RuvC/YqgF family)